MKEEPPLDAKCKDKFVIQSMLIPSKKAGISLRDLVGPFQHIPGSDSDFLCHSGPLLRMKGQETFTLRK